MTYGNVILMPYDCFIDMDLGLINIMKDKYNNPEIVHLDLLNADEVFIIYALIDRDDENPLSIVLKDRYLDNKGSLRDQLLDKEYDRIIELSKPNKIFNLLNLIFTSEAAKVDILCSDERQEKHCQTLLKDIDINTLIGRDLSKIDISVYDSIFIRDYSNILRYKNLIGKNIYTLDYRFNTELDPNGHLRPIVSIEGLISDKNNTSIISSYDLNELKILG